MHSRFIPFSDVLLQINPKAIIYSIVCFLIFISMETIHAQTDTTSVKKAETLINITGDKVIQSENNLSENSSSNYSTQRRYHSPRRATIYSLCLPGLGQAYNRKYWKMPVIYAGFGVLGYFIVNNNNKYHTFLDAYKFVANNETGTPPNEMVDRYERNAEKLRSIKNFYLRNLEISYIATAIFYILQVVDAAVDAHFFYFDVDDNLSMQVMPSMWQNPYQKPLPTAGLSLVFHLK